MTQDADLNEPRADREPLTKRICAKRIEPQRGPVAQTVGDDRHPLAAHQSEEFGLIKGRRLNTPSSEGSIARSRRAGASTLRACPADAGNQERSTSERKAEGPWPVKARAACSTSSNEVLTR